MYNCLGQHKEYSIEIRKLSVEAIEVIATDIFEIEKVEDLESYF